MFGNNEKVVHSSLTEEELVTGILGKNHRKGGVIGKTALVDTTGHLHVALLSPVRAPLIAHNPEGSSSGIRAVPDQINTVIDSTGIEAGWILEDSLTKMENILFWQGRPVIRSNGAAARYVKL